jgi:short-subunit dehydrogenase
MRSAGELLVQQQNGLLHTRLMVVGASKGLGRAFIEGLCVPGDKVVGVSRRRPNDLSLQDSVSLDWIEADLAAPLEAARHIERLAPTALDVLIYNLGLWEDAAFTADYSFLDESDENVVVMDNINIVGTGDAEDLGRCRWGLADSETIVG